MIAYSSEQEVDPPPETSKKNAKWKDRPPLILKYVDDNLQLNKVNMETAPAAVSYTHLTLPTIYSV